ncbi:metabolite/H+ symporter, major facilitator superfamily (MFS), partial [Salmonella enterica subsp. enterica serovar Anatum str. USDA 100]
MDADDGGDWFRRDGAHRRPAGGRIWPSESMVIITTLTILFALFAFTPLLGSGNPALVFVFLLLGLSLMGLTF